MRSILTIVTATDTYDLTLRQTVKDELGLTNGSKDSLIDRYIDVASSAIPAYLNRVLAQETVSETIRDFCHAQALPLKRTPVTDIDSVTVDGAALAASEYEVDPDSGLLYRLSGNSQVCWSGSVVVVQYTGGYELLETLPNEIEEAAIWLAKGMYYARARDPKVKSEEVPDVGTFEYWVGPMPGQSDYGFPPEVISMLAPHRRQVIA